MCLLNLYIADDKINVIKIFWSTPSIWSLSYNGPPTTVSPDEINKVVIKRHDVTINSNIKSAGFIITSINDNTHLKVDGNSGCLTVKGNVVLSKEDNANSDEVLSVENNGMLAVIN